MAVMVYVNGKNVITTIQVNLLPNQKGKRCEIQGGGQEMAVMVG